MCVRFRVCARVIVACLMDSIRPVPQKIFLAVGMVLRIGFRREFSHLPGGLQHFADSNSIPLNQPTTFHPSPIATVQQTSLILLCVPLSQQYHSSHEVLKFDDSMTSLHRICQIPMKC